MNITYKSVSYFGQKRENLHFIDLSVDGKNYGDLIIAIKTELGAKLNNYCLEKETVIEVESTGDDLDLIAISDDDLILSIKDSVYSYFDTMAISKGFTGYLDCLASINSNDTEKAKYSQIFNDWLDENLAIFNEICDDYQDDKIDNLSVDYVIEHFTPLDWNKDVDDKLATLESAVADLGNLISDIYTQIEELKSND